MVAYLGKTAMQIANEERILRKILRIREKEAIKDQANAQKEKAMQEKVMEDFHITAVPASVKTAAAVTMYAQPVAEEKKTIFTFKNIAIAAGGIASLLFLV